MPVRRNLRLLDDQPSLWKLIAAWPNVERPFDWRDTVPGRAEVTKNWSELSGVPEFEIRYNWLRLFGNKFINEDGGIDPDTAEYVDMLTAAEVRKRAPRN